MGDLGKALGDWLELKRQYEDFTDEKGDPCQVSSDSLEAAMYRIMPRALEEAVMFKAEDFGSFDALYDRLVAYSSTKHSMSIGDSTAKLQNPTKDIGAVAGDRKSQIQCWECFEYGHFGRDCPKKGKAKGKDQAKGKGKGGGTPGSKGHTKGKGKGAEKGKGKGKGKHGSFNSFGAETSSEDWQDHESWWQSGEWHNPTQCDQSWWSGPVAPAASQSGSGAQQQPEEEMAGMFNVDVSAVDAPHPGKPKYIVEHDGEEWIRFNYDTGASTVAIPGYLAEDLNLEKVGEFVVASGSTIPNYGRVAFKIEDENGLKRGIKGSVTDVHKPLGGGSEISKNLDAYVWDTAGVLLPRAGPVARGLEKECNRLVRLHGNYGKIDLHREGNLYNFYVKKVGKTELAPVSAPEQGVDSNKGPVSAPDQSAGWKKWPKTSRNVLAETQQQARIKTRNRWADLDENSNCFYWGSSAGSGFTRPAKP